MCAHPVTELARAYPLLDGTARFRKGARERAFRSTSAVLHDARRPRMAWSSSAIRDSVPGRGGDIPLPPQAKLLRFIDQNSVKRWRRPDIKWISGHALQQAPGRGVAAVPPEISTID